MNFKFPEHEDFHYAQEISKQLSANDRQNQNEDVNKKKRSLEESSSKTESNSKKSAPPTSSKSKKPKTDGNLKSIDNYFKKIDK